MLIFESSSKFLRKKVVCCLLHELQRVFLDRLVTPADQKWFHETVETKYNAEMKEHGSSSGQLRNPLAKCHPDPFVCSCWIGLEIGFLLTSVATGASM